MSDKELREILTLLVYAVEPDEDGASQYDNLEDQIETAQEAIGTAIEKLKVLITVAQEEAVEKTYNLIRNQPPNSVKMMLKDYLASLRNESKE